VAMVAMAAVVPSDNENTVSDVITDFGRNCQWRWRCCRQWQQSPPSSLYYKRTYHEPTHPLTIYIYIYIICTGRVEETIRRDIKSYMVEETLRGPLCVTARARVCVCVCVYTIYIYIYTPPDDDGGRLDFYCTAAATRYIIHTYIYNIFLFFLVYLYILGHARGWFFHLFRAATLFRRTVKRYIYIQCCSCSSPRSKSPTIESYTST